MTTERITLAAVSGAHGIRGELRLKLFADGPATIASQRSLWIGGTAFKLEAVGGTAKAVTIRVAGVRDRSAAEALRGSLVEIDRTELPPLAEGEYYHVDLIGLSCVDAAGEPLGTVSSVENYGAGDLLEVEGPDGRRSLIPFKPGIADLADGRITLDPAFLA